MKLHLQITDEDTGVCGAALKFRASAQIRCADVGSMVVWKTGGGINLDCVLRHSTAVAPYFE
jgi:hypothetical protein